MHIIIRSSKGVARVFRNLSGKWSKKPTGLVNKSQHQQDFASKNDGKIKIIPESVNYHFTRTCNYSCGFCFHTAKTSFNLPLDQAKRGLQMLVNDGMKKVHQILTEKNIIIWFSILILFKLSFQGLFIIIHI